jgi:hypothetical protein
MVTFTLGGPRSDQPWWRIISPMEVEAVSSHPDVDLCCSMPCMMSFRKLSDYPRHGSRSSAVGLALHEYLGDRLAAPKWPQCLVFMDGLPRVTPTSCCVSSWVSAWLPGSTTPCTHRATFEAKCPRKAPLETPFLCTVVASASAVEKVLVEALVTSETSNL